MPQEIRHLVVLMMENRSFDHMLGYLDLPSSDGLKEGMYNPIDPGDPKSEHVSPRRARSDVLQPDPNHEFGATTVQLFGHETTAPPSVATCDGFVAAYTALAGDAVQGRRIMECMTPAHAPALATLAREFAVCDRWFSSIPGPTWPNRFFAHAATSDGLVENVIGDWRRGLREYPMRSIYETLEEAEVPWRIYFHDIPQSLALTRMQSQRMRRGFSRISHFYDDARAGRLPQYSFIEPQYFGLFRWPANDQHGGHSVAVGDRFIADVYEALRSNEEAWPHTMLLIVYDEHGGFFDHVSPPVDAVEYEGKVARVPCPDGKTSASPPFDFRRLGVRVPAIVVSPWVAKGRVHHQVFDHASIPATVREIANLRGALTERDAQASSFHGIADLTSMRDDTPITLPRVDLDDAQRGPSGLSAPFNPMGMVPEDTAHSGPWANEPLNDLQQTLMDLADGLDPRPENRVLSAGMTRNTEQAAAVDVNRRVVEFLGR